MGRNGFEVIELIFPIFITGIFAAVVIPKLTEKELGSDNILVKAGKEIRAQIENDSNKDEDNNLKIELDKKIVTIENQKQIIAKLKQNNISLQYEIDSKECKCECDVETTNSLMGTGY
jgi:pantoate kinase